MFALTVAFNTKFNTSYRFIWMASVQISIVYLYGFCIRACYFANTTVSDQLYWSRVMPVTHVQETCTRKILLQVAMTYMHVSCTS